MQRLRLLHWTRRHIYEEFQEKLYYAFIESVTFNTIFSLLLLKIISFCTRHRPLLSFPITIKFNHSSANPLLLPVVIRFILIIQCSKYIKPRRRKKVTPSIPFFLLEKREEVNSDFPSSIDDAFSAGSGGTALDLTPLDISGLYGCFPRFRFNTQFLLIIVLFTESLSFIFVSSHSFT